ncbi:MAG TPA: response regulator [Burkholderiales bacterium]|nr:response regulator [Burkholderiales bacterium]
MTSHASLQKILYVDDERDIRTVARMALEMVGKFTVKACSSGGEALDEFPAFQPDLVLLDVMMPEMDGPTTLERIRGLSGGAQVPVVFMTAKVQPHEVAELKKLGALDVIPKPFDPMTLSSAIRTIWDGAAG